MSGARIFAAENRLSKALSPKGCTSAELVGFADDRVKQLEGEIRAYVRDKLDLIVAFTSLDEDLLFGESRQLGEHALSVADVAGAAGMAGVGEIARGISSMVENLLSSGIGHADALRLHLNAIALLSRRAESDSAEEEVVLARLRGMRGAIGIVE